MSDNASDNDFNRTRPDNLDSSTPPTAYAARNTAADGKVSPWLWALLGVLIVMALAVIFVLPTVVSEYDLPLARTAPVAEQPVVANGNGSSSTVNAVSPFEEAQISRRRKEAQDALAALLEAQAVLDESGVASWGEEEYMAAVSSAALGDEAYRSQDFEGATSHYQQGLSEMQALVDSMPEVFAGLVQRGETALGEGQSDAARESFSRALEIEPDSQEAQVGLARAETLDQVIALLDQGREHQQAGRYAEAEDLFEEALALDERHTEARELVEQVGVQITDQQFARTMSEGFRYLEGGEAERAIAAFEQAARLKPGSGQAQQAITQTRDQLTLDRLSEHRSRAESYEEQEQWESAVAEYDAALELDSNIVFAVEGRDYASKRLQLDRLLQEAIERPERLAEDSVYEQTLDVYHTGRQLEEGGPRLARQLQELESLLQEVQTPVNVRLQSDANTNVTIYKVGELGSFQSRTLSLKPGRYVAVGTRPGFRDVREEFVVGFGKTPESVVVQCREEVLAVNGR